MIADSMAAVADLFAPGGRLSQRIPGYTHRRAQQQMASAVARTLETQGLLIGEAGTGTGKTFAYLVPALLSRRKVIVSTGTRTLQDQLFHRDLPVIRRALAAPGRVALLKGRANYLCRHRLTLTLEDIGRRSRDQRDALIVISQWAGRTRGGDIAELDLPEDSPIWPWVTSSSDNCLGQDCPEWQDCHLVEARRRAQEADLLVINHHLLAADWALKEGGFGEVLPGFDALIIDEAHQFPEVLGVFFGQALSGRQIFDFVRDTELAAAHRAIRDLHPLLEGLRQIIPAFRLALGTDNRRGTWQEVSGQPALARVLSTLSEGLSTLDQALTALTGHDKDLDHCQSRCQMLRHTLATLTASSEPDGSVRWFETFESGFRLHCTPLDIAGIAQAQRTSHPAAWVFTSATLALGARFDHFIRQLGLQGAETQCWESPFDFPRQALCYLPPSLPDPAVHDYSRQVAELALTVIGLSRGRTFLLVTSHRVLREAALFLKPKLPYPLLVQGEAPRGELLDRFRRLGNAVLIGTASFWEGVDVRGEALSCVIIDRLPFASPGDPLIKARLAAIRHQGGNPFRDYQLPQAVIALKQGAGRLIRDESDRGVLVLCDPRLLTKGYGRTFLNSLPPMTQTRALATVADFFGSSKTHRPT